MMRTIASLLGLVATVLAVSARSAFAEATFPNLKVIGKPLSDKISFQPAATGSMRDVVWLDGFLNIICAAIVLFVVVVMLWIIIRYNERANPTPAKFTHNTRLEIVWTLIPVLILLVIGAVSVPILFKQQIIPEADVTIKATSHQWYWSYNYADHDFEFDSFLLERDKLEENGYNQDEWVAGH